MSDKPIEPIASDPGNAIKVAVPLPPNVHDALKRDAKDHRRELTEHIQRLLTEHVISEGLLPPDEADRIKLFWSLVERAVSTAKQICRDGHFDPDITFKAVQSCTADQKWAADYRELVQDDIFKNGNPRKGPINREIGYRIRAGIGGKVMKREDGKPMMRKALGSIIQSYTPMEDYDPEAVQLPA